MNLCFRRLRTCSIALAALLVFAFAARIDTPGFAQASSAGAPGYIFILDGSGSMNAQIQGKTKMEVAKEALTGLIKDLPEGIGVGLVAYGHRQKGDCTDVEEVSPLSPLDKAFLIGKIKAINPKGMTPITYSVRKVAEKLRAVEQETTIVLVSDGEETCKGDPCELVRELKSSGIKFVMHVIGFDVTEKEKAQLACMARAGDGFYYTARNAGELKAAATKAVEKKGPAAGTLTIKAVKDGKPLRAFSLVFKSEGEGDAKNKIAESWTENGNRAFQLPPGTYDAVVEHGEGPGKQTVAFQGIQVEPDKNIEKVADFSGGILSIQAMRNGTPCRAYCTIYKGAGNGNTEVEKVTAGWTGDPAGFPLPPGTYDATVENRVDHNRPSTPIQGITISSGKRTEKTVEFSGGTLLLKALRNDKPIRAFCLIYKADNDEEEDREKVAESWIDAGGTTFNFTPGVYDITVENQDDADKPRLSFDGVTVEAAKTVEKVADFSGGTLKIAAKRNGKPFSAFCRVLKTDGAAGGDGTKVAQRWTGNEGAVIRLQPGTYDVIVENQEDAGKPSQKFPGITLEMGKTIEKVADFSGGAIKVTAMRNGKPFSAYSMIFTGGEGSERKQVSRAWTHEEGALFLLPPGVYDIVVENQTDADRPSVRLGGITVEAGKTVEKVAEFSGGSLKVKALKNGKPFSAYCTVLPGGDGADRKKLASAWTRDEGALFQLPAGVYDIVVENQADADRPSVRLGGITVEAGKTVEKVAEFSGGSLKVMASRNGKPLSAYCTVFGKSEGNERKKIGGSWSREEGAIFRLMPGVYDVVIENQADASRPKVEFTGITVEAGKSVEKAAEFSGGSIQVRAIRNGKPFSALAMIFTVDEASQRKQVTRQNTREEGALFQLLPGTYLVVVEDSKAREKKEFKDITVEAGKNRVMDVQF